MTRWVVVVGPPQAGVGGVLAALRARLPQYTVVGPEELDPQRAPDAVVAVVSAVAPLTRSDWELVARAAARTDLVVGAVSKIDAHRNWRDVLAADRDLAAGWDAPRRSIPWVGVAAAPRLGEPDVDDLVAVLGDGLADPTLDERNQLRDNRFRRERSRRTDGSPVIESRVALQRVRLRLLRDVRDGCASIRTELRDAASAVPAGGAGPFEARVRDHVASFVADLDLEITRAVVGLADDLGLDRAAAARREGSGVGALPHVEAAPGASRRLETRLMAVLGVGLGLGIALAANRLLSGLAPGLSIAGWVAGVGLGSTVVAWVVRTRGILHQRALLDRWVTDVAGTLRWHGEAMVADRLLTVESAHAVAVRASARGT